MGFASPRWKIQMLSALSNSNGLKFGWFFGSAPYSTPVKWFIALQNADLTLIDQAFLLECHLCLRRVNRAAGSHASELNQRPHHRWWLVRWIIPKLLYFRLVNYCNLPTSILEAMLKPKWVERCCQLAPVLTHIACWDLVHIFLALKITAKTRTQLKCPCKYWWLECFLVPGSSNMIMDLVWVCHLMLQLWAWVEPAQPASPAQSRLQSVPWFDRPMTPGLSSRWRGLTRMGRYLLRSYWRNSACERQTYFSGWCQNA